MKKLSIGFLLLCAVAIFTTPAMAAFTNVVAFGDSITDNGYADGYGFATWTTGLPWADQLAGFHSASILNVAHGGALTGYGHLSLSSTEYGLNWQVENPGVQSAVSIMGMDTTLFTVWAGANDYNYLIGSTGGTASAAEKQAAALNAVDNIMAALATLRDDLNAEYIVVPNMMLLGDGNFALTYNTYLATRLAAFSFDGTIYDLDMFSLYSTLFNGVLNDPADPLSGVNTDLAMLYGLLWTDGYHPGPATHAAMAYYAYQATSVPVPGAMLLLGSGLLALTGINRKKAA